MRTAFLSALLVLALVAAVVIRWQPSSLALLRPCPFLALTGSPCPTCGTMRALGALGRGDVSGALRSNPLAAAALLLLVPATVASACARRLRPLSARAQRAALWVGTALALLNWGFLVRH